MEVGGEPIDKGIEPSRTLHDNDTRALCIIFLLRSKGNRSLINLH